MRNVIIAVVAVVCFVALGVVSLLPQNNNIQPTFTGKRYVQKSTSSPVLNIMSESWLSSSEFAGREVQFGMNKFITGKTYTLPKIGIEESEDIWNYVNGTWFEWESADGRTYSVRMNGGVIDGYKTNGSFKPVEMLYDTTYGITRVVELFIFNGILNTDIMPFVDGVRRQVKYFMEETKPSDYYLTKSKIVVGKEPILKVSQESVISEPIKESKPVYYGLRIGDTAPLFNMELLDGRKYKLSDYYGRKIVLNIWATFCGICITEFPIINEAYLDNKGVNVLAVCADGSVKQIQRIKDKYSVRYPCEFTMASSIGVDKTYTLKGFPTTYFLDENGIIKHVKIGAFSSEQEVEDILNSY
jgi:peroxiredoxin